MDRKERPNKTQRSSDIAAALAEQDEVPLPPRKRHQESKKDSTRTAGGSKFDLTTVSGQAAAHPDWTLEQCKQESAREYNRMNAARARARNKKMLMELQERVAHLKQREIELLRENGALRAQLDFYKNQKEATAALAPPGPATLNLSTRGHPSLPGMPKQGLQQQSSIISQLGQGSTATASFSLLSSDLDTSSSVLVALQESEHSSVVEQPQRIIGISQGRLPESSRRSGFLALSSSVRSTQEHAGLSSLASLVSSGLPPHLTALLETTTCTGESSAFQGFGKSSALQGFRGSSALQGLEKSSALQGFGGSSALQGFGGATATTREEDSEMQALETEEIIG